SRAIQPGTCPPAADGRGSRTARVRLAVSTAGEGGNRSTLPAAVHKTDNKTERRIPNQRRRGSVVVRCGIHVREEEGARTNGFGTCSRRGRRQLCGVARQRRAFLQGRRHLFPGARTD